MRLSVINMPSGVYGSPNLDHRWLNKPVAAAANDDKTASGAIGKLNEPPDCEADAGWAVLRQSHHVSQRILS